MTVFTLNGVDYDTTDFREYGYKTPVIAGTGETLPRWTAAMVDAVADCGASVAAASDSAASAATQLTNVNSAASTAISTISAITASRLAATSSSSVSVATGSKVFTTAENLITTVPLKVGDFFKASLVSDPSVYLFGYVTAVATNTLTGTATRKSGTGTQSGWLITATGADGVDASLDAIGSLAGSLTSATIANDDLCAFFDTSASVTKKMTFLELVLALKPYFRNRS